jgi:isopentenyl-diphosphate delta-isomerase
MSTSEHKKVVVVDELDNIIGAEDMLMAIHKGLLRRASRVYVFNISGQLLMQRRSKNVLKPLLLDQSAGGHVDEGETNLQAAERELFEELGLRDFVLEEIDPSLRTEHFYSGVYRLVVPDGVVLKIDPYEIDSVMWFTIQDLEEKIKNKPDEFTPSFLEAWPQLRDKLIP